MDIETMPEDAVAVAFREIGVNLHEVGLFQGQEKVFSLAVSGVLTDDRRTDISNQMLILVEKCLELDLRRGVQYVSDTSH